MINIETSIVCTILENNFISMDKNITNFKIEDKYFNSPELRFIVKGINRLKELDEPIDLDILKYYIYKSDNYLRVFSSCFMLDDFLIKLISSNSLTYNSLCKYYDILKKEYEQHKRTKELLYI